ncbi:MAG: DUF3179 domain-containing protein [Actinobacteria bacterium]|nr:DUF3179 domain-containing protein [Actinomycetota bacterium]
MARRRWHSAIPILVVAAALGGLVAPDSPPGPRGAGAAEPPAPPPSYESPYRQDPSRPVTGTVNFACTVQQRYQAVVNLVGPFCLPPDSIRAIDRPVFEPAATADFLADDEPVLAVEVEGDARAYPLRVLVWHEIVNDEVGGEPVAVTFCPLCSSGVAFERTVEGRVLTFAVSGRLIGANLIMFDRETETLWQQLTGEARRGQLAGRRLGMVPVRMLSFSDFRAAWPDGRVMTEDTGFAAFYGRDPYPAYGRDPNQESRFTFGASSDPRLPPKARVLGIVDGETAVAVPYPADASGRRVVEIEGRDGRIVVLLEHGVGLQGTAGSFEELASGWAGAAYLPRLAGRSLDIAATADGFLDRRTGTLFDLTGLAVEGPLAGGRLRSVPALDSYWFAWAYFHPGTRIAGPGP